GDSGRAAPGRRDFAAEHLALRRIEVDLVLQLDVDLNGRIPDLAQYFGGRRSSPDTQVLESADLLVEVPDCVSCAFVQLALARIERKREIRLDRTVEIPARSVEPRRIRRRSRHSCCRVPFRGGV